MPFGKKSDSNGQMIDFNMIYKALISPAIKEAGMEPLRSDEEKIDGIIHKPMFERLILCEFAIADLTTANPNVFYELGVRHAVRPYTTILIYSNRTRLPFDVSMLRAIPYNLTDDGQLRNVNTSKKMIFKRLLQAKKDVQKDSPLYQLLEDYPNVQHEKTDVFRERINYSEKIKQKLTAARNKGLKAINKIEKKLEPIIDQEAGSVVDLFLSYRSVEAWNAMLALSNKMSAPVANSVMIQEQIAFALNRLGKHEKAEQVLIKLLSKRGLRRNLWNTRTGIQGSMAKGL